MSTFVNVGDQWLVNVDKLNSNDGFIMYSYHLIFLIHFLYNAVEYFEYFTSIFRRGCVNVLFLLPIMFKILNIIGKIHL